MQVRKQQLELDMEQQTCSKSGKDYVKAVYCHPAYLTYMHSTSWETLGCIKHKLVKIAGRNSSNLRYADDTTFMAEKEEEVKRLLKVNEEWKSWLKTQYSKNEDNGIQSHHSWQIDGETVETVTDFIF